MSASISISSQINQLDIEKAYDHVSWSFLMATLKKMGFTCKWRSKMHFCLSRVRYYVLINGEASEFFPRSRSITYFGHEDSQ